MTDIGHSSVRRPATSSRGYPTPANRQRVILDATAGSTGTAKPTGIGRAQAIAVLPNWNGTPQNPLKSPEAALGPHSLQRIFTWTDLRCPGQAAD